MPEYICYEKVVRYSSDNPELAAKYARQYGLEFEKVKE